MALYLLDMVKETTATTGVGSTYTLAGPVTNFTTFVAGATARLGAGPWTGDEFFYVCTDNAGAYEFGSGEVIDAASDTIARTNIYTSSNSDAKVDWAAGDKDIFAWLPGEQWSPPVLLQQQVDKTTSSVNTTTTIPDDDTAPTISEGTDTGLSVSITPANTNNILKFTFTAAYFECSTSAELVLSVFQDSTNVGTFCEQVENVKSGGHSFTGYVTAGGTAAQTWTARFGTTGGNTVYMIDDNGSARFGTTDPATLIIEEFKV
jgi:hypothetical protein